jgi:hypothetical protein
MNSSMTNEESETGFVWKTLHLAQNVDRATRGCGMAMIILNMRKQSFRPIKALRAERTLHLPGIFKK